MVIIAVGLPMGVRGTTRMMPGYSNERNQYIHVEGNVIYESRDGQPRMRVSTIDRNVWSSNANMNP
jgi:hypothetical protein